MAGPELPVGNVTAHFILQSSPEDSITINFKDGETDHREVMRFAP